ncbi:MAG: hypothetical protein AB8H47_01545, partial [Bacteroidia bacterium]
MPIGINYKRLVEIHILQEYFLRAKDEEDVFGMDQAAFDALIAEKIKRQKYNIHNELLIEPSLSTKALLAQQKLRILSTSLGFFLASQLSERAGDAGLMQYSPYLPLKRTEALIFSMRPQRLSNFKSFTQQRLDRRLPAIYYFSNLSENDLLPPADKNAPSLSLPVMAE